MAQTNRKSTTKKDKNSFTSGVVHIQSTFNNTIVTITNLTGDTVSWASAGSSGFKGARKGTPFASKIVIDSILKRCFDFGIKQIKILVTGSGPGRESAIRSLQKVNLQIILIRDMTPMPHNGCRPPKKRRI